MKYFHNDENTWPKSCLKIIYTEDCAQDYIKIVCFNFEITMTKPRKYLNLNIVLFIITLTFLKLDKKFCHLIKSNYRQTTIHQKYVIQFGFHNVCFNFRRMFYIYFIS